MANVITGRVYDILIINEMVAQIVIKKKDRDKFVDVAISVYGYWKDKALKEVGIKDKIRGNLYIRSKFHNGKYYTDCFFRDVLVTEKAPMKIPKLFDKETGEVFE